MFRTAAISLCLVVALASTGTANKEESRLENSGVVLEEVLGVPDNIPRELLDKAECVIVIPSMLKVAVGLGGNYGRGAMACRTGPAFAGSWGAPAMYALDGASLRPDNDASEQVYGRRITARTIINATDLAVPAAGRRFVDALEKSAPRNDSKVASR